MTRRPGRWRPAGWRLLVIEATTLVVLVTILVALSTTPLLPPVAQWGPTGTHAAAPQISAGGRDLPVFVTPQRPGWNLVLLPGEGGAVGAGPASLTPALPRAGANGSWALVELPEGPSELWVRRDGAVAELTIRTRRGSAPDLRGPDGPECASAQLARALVGAPPLDRCPADRLLAADEAALRDTVGFIADRGAGTLSLVADGSARSDAAAAAVRAEAAARGLVVEPTGSGNGPVVVVAGWEKAAITLHEVAASETPADPIYLAPWLLSAPLLTVPAGQLLIASFAPDDETPQRYVAALAAALDGAPATASGYAAWLSAQDMESSYSARGARLYAPAMFNPDLQANAGRSHDHGSPGGSTGWFPDGRLTAVTGDLSRSHDD